MGILEDTKKDVLLMLVLLVVAISAIFAAYSVHLSRQYIGEMSRLNKQQDELQVQWEKLLVELNMLTAYNRVELEAVKRLGMGAPRVDQLRVLDLRSSK